MEAASSKVCRAGVDNDLRERRPIPRQTSAKGLCHFAIHEKRVGRAKYGGDVESFESDMICQERGIESKSFADPTLCSPAAFSSVNTGRGTDSQGLMVKTVRRGVLFSQRPGI
jgi:hypothetical protein